MEAPIKVFVKKLIKTSGKATYPDKRLDKLY